MRPKDCAYIVEHLSVRFMAMVADHSRQLAEHRAAFGARTEADAKIIAGLREESAKYKAESDHFYQREGIEQKRRIDSESERDGLLTQVQDMRAEMERLKSQMAEQEVSVVGVINERNEAWDRCDALRADVAALQERMRASIVRGDFEQMEVAALKSQTPKQHPVAVGEWVRRLVPSPACGVGTVAKVVQVDDTSEIYDVKRIDGQHGVWFAKNCEPCDPPEATHDTEAGKAAAQNAEKTEQVADEIKVGDLVEVVSNRGRNTWLVDVGSLGIVTSVEYINDSISVHLDDVPGKKKNALVGCVSFCDVRKVTT